MVISIVSDRRVKKLTKSLRKFEVQKSKFRSPEFQRSFRQFMLFFDRYRVSRVQDLCRIGNRERVSQYQFCQSRRDNRKLGLKLPYFEIWSVSYEKIVYYCKIYLSFK